MRFVWLALPVIGCFVVVVFVRGLGRYGYPDWGGDEPAANHYAALEILSTGRTTMMLHATGYSYLVALVYAFLPNVPLSVLAIQGLLLPAVVIATVRIAEKFGGDLAGRCALIVSGTYYAFPYYAAVFTGVFPPYLAVTGSIAVALPLLEKSAPRRAAIAGILLGVAVCCRPNMALVGVVLFASIWWATRSVKTAFVRVLPVGAISLGMLVLMTLVNPPEPGQFVRGSYPMNRSILEGTYQFQDRWWDWEPFGDEKVMAKFWVHEKRLEAESGHPMEHPDTQRLMRRDGLQRIRDYPLNSLKKAVISSVRIWILIPTQFDRLLYEVPFALLEGVLLALAIGGIVITRRRGGPWYLGVGVMAVVAAAHLVLHVEPRYSLPAKGVEVAFIAVALSALVARRTAPAAVAQEPALLAKPQ
jgi:hypothetical protein